MQTFLICGGTKDERSVKAQELTEGIAKEDLIFLTQEDSLGIGEIRELEHRLNLKPYRGTHKACIIETAQDLTIPAQNALLKTLEEPPKNTFIILCATTAESLLPTIVSRCQIIQLAPKASIELSEKEFQAHLSNTDGQLSGKIGERLKLASKVAGSRQEALEFLEKQTLVWRNILLWKVQVHKPPMDGLSPLLAGLTIKQLLAILSNLQQNRRLIESNINPRLAVENFFLDLPGLPDEQAGLKIV